MQPCKKALSLPQQTNELRTKTKEKRTMKATEILSKKLEINSSMFGCKAYPIVDFEINEIGFLKLWYDSNYNDESHTYGVVFSVNETNKMLRGGEVADNTNEGFRITTTYRLID